MRQVSTAAATAFQFNHNEAYEIQQHTITAVLLVPLKVAFHQ